MDNFLSITVTFYVIANPRKDKGKVFKEYILNKFASGSFDARTKEMQKEHYQQATQMQNTITDYENQTQVIQFENLGIKGKVVGKQLEIDVLQRCYVRSFGNEYKENDISIVLKRNEAVKYPKKSTCRQQDHTVAG